MANDETTFITGFPGFIAARLLKRLAADGGRFLLLVQPAFLERAREEIVVISRETQTPPDRFRILQGDITQPDLGLSPVDAETARRETTRSEERRVGREGNE